MFVSNFLGKEKQKRFYTRGILKSIRISRLAKILVLKLRKGLIICIEEKRGLKDFHCITQNAALFVDLLKNIFWRNKPLNNGKSFCKQLLRDG